MKNKLNLFLVTCLILLILSPVYAATLLNLATQVKGVLAGANGGTGLSSSGTAGNVLTSTGGSGWASSPVGAGTLLGWNARQSSGYKPTVAGGASVNFADCFAAFTSSGGGSATTQNQSLTFPVAVRLDTGAATNDIWGANSCIFQLSGRNLTYQARVWPNSSGDETSVRTWFGWSGNVLNAASNDTPTTTIEAFRFSTGASDVHYMCVTGVSGTQTATDSGVAPDSTAPHYFEIDETATTNVLFKIDGTTVCTNTTNLPAAAGVLGNQTVNAFLTITALSASTKDWEYAYIWDSYDK